MATHTEKAIVPLKSRMAVGASYSISVNGKMAKGRTVFIAGFMPKSLVRQTKTEVDDV